MEVITNPSLLYEPPPFVPQSFYDEMAKIVPVCPNNLDLYLRWSWGMDRMEFVKGHWTPRYGDNFHDPPKYIGREGWVLEGYQSPDVFDERVWEQNAHILGPWPRNGVWDFIEYHETPDGGYLPLDHNALDRARNWKHWKSKGHKRGVEELIRQRETRLTIQLRRDDEAAQGAAQIGAEKLIRAFEHSPNREYSVPSPLKGFMRTDAGILIKG